MHCDDAHYGFGIKIFCFQLKSTLALAINTFMYQYSKDQHIESMQMYDGILTAAIR